MDIVFHVTQIVKHACLLTEQPKTSVQLATLALVQTVQKQLTLVNVNHVILPARPVEHLIALMTVYLVMRTLP
jgi:hypothetical protein